MAVRAIHNPQPGPALFEIRRLLDAYRPKTVLQTLDGLNTAEGAVYRAEALVELDRVSEALEALDPVVDKLEGGIYSEAERLRALIKLRLGRVDESILGALKAAQTSQDDDQRAAALAWSAVGLGQKNCWKLAEANLRQAIEISPNAPYVLMAQARVRLEADLRIEAREIYERMSGSDSFWAQVHGYWGCATVAYLMGEFSEAAHQAEAALQASDEIVAPLFLLGKIALAREELQWLQAIVSELERRSICAESLPAWQEELDYLTQIKAGGEQKERRRLEAFPTLVQRRNYCGPSTVELVMRYWKGAAGFSNEQIAANIKLAQAGTPVYRMREFFHLAGFDTIRTTATPEQLRMLVEAGFPVIVQEEYSNTSHVAVVIGFDRQAGVIELQDPMTHTVTRIPEEELTRLRKIYLDGVIIAFLRDKGNEKSLAQMGFFDDQALVWCDRAVLELDQNRIDQAALTAKKVVGRKPALGLGWVLLLHARLELWQRSLHQKAGGLGEGLAGVGKAMRESFYQSLAEAKKIHLEGEFVHQFEGLGALLDHHPSKALQAFQRAVKIDGQDARTYANLAECYYELMEYEKALENALRALDQDPSLPAANAWMARTLAATGRPNAVHFADMALDLSPHWWGSHQALAEACLHEGFLPEALREADLALSLVPGQPEALTVKALSLKQIGETDAAAEILRSVLQGRQLNLETAYRASQALGQISFNQRDWHSAEQYGRRVMTLVPGDRWGQQFLLAARCESTIQQGLSLDTDALGKLERDYERLIMQEPFDRGVIQDYLGYLESFAGVSACLNALRKIKGQFPDKGSLDYLQGVAGWRAGDREIAADSMVKAISSPDGVRNRDELFEAIRMIVETWGADGAEEAVLSETQLVGGAPRSERLRTLGLVLAQKPQQYGERARELLLLALGEFPEDPLVILHLGDVSPARADQEACYRRAVLLRPDWAFGRSCLANFLMEEGRANEALEFTSGHEHESAELVTVHGRALGRLGHYEEAIAVLLHAQALQGIEDNGFAVELWQAQRLSGDYKGALNTARHAARNFSDDPEWSLRTALSLNDLRRFEDSFSMLAKARKKGVVEEKILRVEYELAWRQKDYAGALGIVEQWMEISGESSHDGRLGWGETQILRILAANGEPEEAWRLVEGENPEAEGWGEAARVVLEGDAPSLALALAEKALELNPNLKDGLLARAQALTWLDREAEARQASQEFSEAFPEAHEGYELLAVQQAAGGDLGGALIQAERGVALGAHCPTAWATRGLVHFLDGRTREARDDLQMGWRRADGGVSGRYAYFWWILGVLEGNLGFAEQQRSQAEAACWTGLERRLLGMIGAVLAN